MKDSSADLSKLYQQQSSAVLATLIRLLGDFDLAEEAMHEAFAAALKQWPQDGLPEKPTAWLISTGRFKAIDQIRKRQHANSYLQHYQDADMQTTTLNEHSIQDDQLRLIFICCHPSLNSEAQLTLTLREMCGFTTEQVASALLKKPTTIAQRIVRAKRKIKEADIPYEVPEEKELAARLQSVLQVIYLMFNEGYLQSHGDQLLNNSLSAEAIRLCKLLNQLLPKADVQGLLALMLLHDSRRRARTDGNGDIVTLDEQDRNLWDRQQINQGLYYLTQGLQQRPVGPYCLQAAIAAIHARALSYQDTDWAQITSLYDALYQQVPTPVVALNRAVAIAMRDGPRVGLQLLDELGIHKAIQNYHLYHAARADLHRRNNQVPQAIEAYQKALSLTQQEAEKRFLQRRLNSLQ